MNSKFRLFKKDDPEALKKKTEEILNKLPSSKKVITPLE